MSFFQYLNKLLGSRTPTLEGYLLKFLNKMIALANNNLKHVLPLKMLIANFHFYKKSYEIAGKFLSEIVQVMQGN